MFSTPLVKWCTIVLISILPWSLSAQSKSGSWTDKVDSILSLIHFDQSIDSRTKLNLADSVFDVCVQHKDTCRQVYSQILQAIQLDNIGMADSALAQLYKARRLYVGKCDSVTLMFLFSNLTNVYLSLGELTRLDSVSKASLALWNPSWKNKNSRFSILLNLGIAHAMRSDSSLAISTFRQVLHEAEKDKDSIYIQKALINLGTYKGMINELDSAYYFLNKAAVNAKEVSDMENYMTLLLNLGSLDRERGKYANAIITFDSVYALAELYKSTETLVSVQKARADLYAKMGRFEQAYSFLKKYIKLNEQYLDEERVKAVTEMMEKYESEKKARQIQQLELDKLDAAVKNERITNTRNRYLFVGIAVLLVAIGLWSRLRYVHKSRIAIQHEKDISEGLLLNILPSSVADELKVKGYAEAKLHETATILFSDFKSFTTIAEEMNAVELVEEINTCFKTFDEIMTRYGIEKIKTIGDSYMAAASVPATNKAIASDVVFAALEMQEFVIHRKKERKNIQQPFFEMRIGAHSGPVVAGIVGVKKFQYDLWGDTVNIASRMETAGEVDRVNISEATYQLVKEDPSFKFTYRGMISVKGKGEMAMYFVDHQSPITQN